MATSNKLVFVMSNFTYGGAETQWYEYLKTRPDKLDVEIITFLPNPPESVERLFSELNVKVRLVDRSSMGFVPWFFTLLRTMRQMRPTVVHTVLTGSVDTWGRLAAWLTAVPTIIHSELQMASEVTRTQALLRPFMDRITHRFLPNAHATADWLAAKGIPRDKIVFVPNATDVSKFTPDSGRSLRADWGIPEDALVAGFMAKFRPEKRLDVLLDAVTSLPEQERPDYLVIGGNGEMMPMVKERVEADPWLKERTRVLGIVSDQVSFFKSIDYFMLTSDKEGVPNVVLEAMAMEKPVLTTNVTDLPVILENIGIVAQMGDPQSVAAAMREMQQKSPAERLVMGQAGRKKVLEEFERSAASRAFWQAHADFLTV